MKVLVLHRTLANDYTFNRLYKDPLTSLVQCEINQAQLYYPENVKKVKAVDKVEWLKHVEDKLNQFDIILISDGDYFKTIAGTAKAEGTIGLIYDSKYTSAKVMYIPSVSACTFHPDKHLPKLDLVFKTLKDYSLNQYQEIGTGIIHSYKHPKTLQEIEEALEQLHQYPMLAMDIEAKSLKFREAGIYTIGFAYDEHNYIAFPVDAIPEQKDKARELLKLFLSTFKGKLIVHKANYDITVLNFSLFQNEDIFDIRNQVDGLNTFFGEDCQKIEDTLVITYLATNSCAGNTLGLKELASEFAGDWAVDVKDVTKVPLEELLTYNGIDCLSTWYIYKKYYPIMVQDEQEELYKTFMLPTLKTNIRCQLNGLPIDKKAVLDFERDLLMEENQLLTKLTSYKEIELAEWQLAEEATIKRNSKLKKKQTTVEENLEPINFGSNKHIQVLVYSVMGLPVIETTPSKEPACGKKVLGNLINHTENQTYKEILQALVDLADVRKILTAFVPAFKEADKRLHGYFNLAGTVSGRLSSSNLNLQQLPATGSRFAKPTKKCFRSTNEWVFCGIDFSSLEDRISALTTKDPNKLKIYTDGYDGHMLRAISYFNLPVDVNDVEAVNNAINQYKTERQMSKAPTFACTYGGTYLTLMKNCGLSEEVAKQIEENYHKLYQQSDRWTQKHIRFACNNGYITTGFGLRIRTPILANTIYSSNMSNLASAEARTAGNALGQGWGVLNDRAMNEVLDAIDNLGLTEDVLPTGKVHDACYYLVRNDIDIILKLNELVVKASKWQDHPDIYHPEVGLEGNLDLFYPDWSNAITLPQNCNEQQLIELVKEHQCT